MAINKILIVGGSSKLAKLFISAYANLYEIHATYSSASDNLAPGVFKSYSLDLNDTDSINNFIDTAKDLKFKAVIFFASTFAKDAEDNEERIRQFESDMRINVVSPLIIARSLNYINNDGRIFVFGDIYTSKPLPSMINYSYSKQLLELSTQLLNKQIQKQAHAFCLKLGRIMDYSTTTTQAAPQAAITLIKTINHLIAVDDPNDYGDIIDFKTGDNFKDLD